MTRGHGAGLVEPEFFQQQLIDPLLRLEHDPVPNVRMALARMLAAADLTTLPSAVDVLRRLSRDPDRYLLHSAWEQHGIWLKRALHTLQLVQGHGGVCGSCGGGGALAVPAAAGAGSRGKLADAAALRGHPQQEPHEAQRVCWGG